MEVAVADPARGDLDQHLPGHGHGIAQLFDEHRAVDLADDDSSHGRAAGTSF
jgi:hypothetical protein